MPLFTHMDVPLTITFRNTTRLPALETLIRQRFARLERYCPTLLGGRVVVERSDRRQRSGNDFAIHLVVKLPGEDVAVEHHARARSFASRVQSAPATANGAPSGGVTDVSAAIRRTFDAARRRLQDRERLLRGDVKSHAAAARRKRVS